MLKYFTLIFAIIAVQQVKSKTKYQTKRLQKKTKYCVANQ